MLEFLAGIGSASVWAFWAPVLAWTALAGLGMLALVRLPGLHPIAGYRLRQALLLALPVSILAAPWIPGLLPSAPAPAGPVLTATGSGTGPSAAGDVALGADPGGGVHIALVLLGAATVAVVLLAMARLAILAADLRQLRRLRRVAVRVDDPAPRQILRELAEQLGVRRAVELLEGPPDSAPMTFGGWRPVIMIPRALPGSPDSLAAALAHELIHIRRADYAWALVDCLVSAAFAFHPLVWRLRRGIEHCRETSCDAEVLALGIVHPKPYAELLARTRTPRHFPMPAVATSLSAPSLKLKERLETMKKFAHRTLSSRQRLGIVLGAGLVCVIVAVAGACATRAEEEASARFEVSEVGFTSAEIEGLQRWATEAQAEAELVRSYQSAKFVYQITRGTGSNQHTFRATEEDVLEVLAKLDLEMQYLREQMDATEEAYNELQRSAVEFHANAEDNSTEARALRRDMDELRARADLLNAMRADRMRESETVKMQYETQKRMRGR